MSKERRDFIKDFYKTHVFRYIERNMEENNIASDKVNLDDVFDTMQFAAECTWDGFNDRNKSQKRESNPQPSQEHDKIIDYLNKKAGTTFGQKGAVSNDLNARLKEGWTGADICMMIQYKCREWKGTKMEDYLRPSTLFSKKKFHEYMAQAIKHINQDKDQVARIMEKLGV